MGEFLTGNDMGQEVLNNSEILQKEAEFVSKHLKTMSADPESLHAFHLFEGLSDQQIGEILLGEGGIR